MNAFLRLELQQSNKLMGVVAEVNCKCNYTRAVKSKKNILYIIIAVLLAFRHEKVITNDY